MELVCITGIDGAGKSTLARNLVAALRQQGVPAVYMYGRTYPVISRALMALGRQTLLRGDDIWQDYRGYTARKSQTMRNPLLAGAYTAAILVDYYAQVWAKLLYHQMSRHVVVLDRYLYDTVILDLAAHLNYSVATTDRAILWGLKILPTPALTVLIDLPPEAAFARKDDVPHLDYLRERREWYLRLAGRREVKQYNGLDSPDTLVSGLLQEIASKKLSLKKGSNGEITVPGH